MESLTGGDGKHLHPGHQYNHRRSPSLRYVSIAHCTVTFFVEITNNNQWYYFVSFFDCLYRRRAGSPLVRTPSPRKRNHLHPHHDIGFSDTVSNVVEIAKEERTHHRPYRNNGNSRFPRGTYHSPLITNFIIFNEKQLFVFAFWTVFPVPRFCF